MFMFMERGPPPVALEVSSGLPAEVAEAVPRAPELLY